MNDADDAVDEATTDKAATDDADEVLAAIRPLVRRIGAVFVPPGELTDADVAVVWRGAVLAGVRLTGDDSEPGPVIDEGGLTGVLADVRRGFDVPLADLSRPEKQRAVRMLEEAGAFSYRKSVETVAAALGVSRFTVYNYLNRDRG